MIYQTFNGRAWVKVKRMANGSTKIIDVKQREPRKPFIDVAFFK